METVTLTHKTTATRGLRNKFNGHDFQIILTSTGEKSAIVRMGERFYQTPDHDENRTLFRLAESCRYMIIDMGKVTNIDSAAVSGLLKVRRMLKAQDGAVFIVRPSQFVQKVLKILHVDELIQIEESIDKTLMSLEIS